MVNKLMTLLMFLCGTVVSTSAAENNNYPNPGDLDRIVSNFSYDADDIESMNSYGSSSSRVVNESGNMEKVPAACGNFEKITYGYGNAIVKEIEKDKQKGNGEKKKYLVVFTDGIQSNKSNPDQFCEILTKGNGFCFWNSAFGFDLEDPELEKHIESILSQQLGIKPIEGELFNIDRSGAPNNPDTKSISACREILAKIEENRNLLADIPGLDDAKDVIEAIIRGDKKTIRPFIQNASEVESLVQALEKFGYSIDTGDDTFLCTVFNVINFIKKVTIYGSGIDMEEAKKVLRESPYHFLVYNFVIDELDKPMDNSKKGKPIRLWFDFGTLHFSRLILKNELDDLRKAAKEKGIEVIAYEVEKQKAEQAITQYK